MSGNDFDSQVAIVTGAGSGIGQACAQMLAQRGAKVLIADSNVGAAERVASAIGSSAMAFAVDVADPTDCQAMVDTALSHWGRLDIAVNNAGIGGEQNPIGSYSIAGWRSVMSVNLDGVFYCMRSEIAAMAKTGGGSIVNMSSILGMVGFANAGAYVAAKHGVVGLTQTAALDHAADGIRVNAVGPGFIDTPLLAQLSVEMKAGLAAMHPRGKMGSADEVAELVTFLASEHAANITGSYYTVDGGYTAR